MFEEKSSLESAYPDYLLVLANLSCGFRNRPEGLCSMGFILEAAFQLMLDPSGAHPSHSLDLEGSFVIVHTCGRMMAVPERS